LRNLLKEKLKRGEAVVGAFVGLGHPDWASTGCS